MIRAAIRAIAPSNWRDECERILRDADWKLIATVHLDGDDWDLAFVSNDNGSKLLVRLLSELTTKRLEEDALLRAKRDFAHVITVTPGAEPEWPLSTLRLGDLAAQVDKLKALGYK